MIQEERISLRVDYFTLNGSEACDMNIEKGFLNKRERKEKEKEGRKY